MGCNHSSLLPAEIMTSKYVKDFNESCALTEAIENKSQKSGPKSPTNATLPSMKSSTKSLTQFRKLTNKSSLNSYLFTNGIANRRNQIIEIRKDTQEIKCRTCEYKLEFCCLSLGGFKATVYIYIYILILLER